MKIGHDNDVTNHKGTIYVESDTKLSWLIRSSVDCDKKTDKTTTRFII